MAALSQTAFNEHIRAIPLEALPSTRVLTKPDSRKIGGAVDCHVRKSIGTSGSRGI
jgi:hypothetical protein